MRTVPLSASIFAAFLLAGCAGTNTIRTSVDTAIIQVSAAPVCRGTGAARVAQMQAAIETLKAGYDRYIVIDMAAANNVRVIETPGRYRTTGTLSGGSLYATTTYQPGMPIVAGTHEQALAIKMYRDGEPGSAQAVPARSVLGDKWQEMVKAGAINTCA